MQCNRLTTRSARYDGFRCSCSSNTHIRGAASCPGKASLWLRRLRLPIFRCPPVTCYFISYAVQDRGLLGIPKTGPSGPENNAAAAGAHSLPLLGTIFHSTPTASWQPGVDPAAAYWSRVSYGDPEAALVARLGANLGAGIPASAAASEAQPPSSLVRRPLKSIRAGGLGIQLFLERPP